MVWLCYNKLYKPMELLMNYLVLLLVGLAVIIFLLNVKNFNTFIYRVIYIVSGFAFLVGVIVLVQPDEYVVYSSNPKFEPSNKANKKIDTQIQNLALKMKTEGFSEEQIIESFSHEYPSRLDVALQLENAGFSAVVISKYFKNYQSNRALPNRKLTREEYSRHIIEQDVKRFAVFSQEDRNTIRRMESNKESISAIKELFTNYEPNDEIKAIELGQTGKSLREVKKIFPNYEPKK